MIIAATVLIRHCAEGFYTHEPYSLVNIIFFFIR